MNAIIHRELVAMLRSRRTTTLQLMLIIGLGAMVILRWPADAHVDIDGTSSQQVLRVFGYGLMTILTLVAPVFSATSIVRERVQGTLALILNSPIHPLALVLGKLVSAVGYVLLLTFFSIPAAAACFAMGGVDLYDQLGRMYLVLILLAIQFATLGLLVSSYATTIDAALRVTYGIILLLTVFTLVPYYFFAGATWLSPTLATIIDWLRCSSPIPAMMHLLGDSSVGSGGLISDATVVTRYCIVAAGLSVVFAIWTATKLNSRVLDRPRQTGKVTDEQSLRVRTVRRIMYLWFFDPQRRSGMIAAWQNPVMVKELRCRRFGRSNWMMRLIAACLIVSLLLVLAATSMSQSHSVSTMGGIMVMMQISLIILLTPSLAAGLISSERESRGWQLLQTTPMSATTIVAGKLMSVMLTLLLVLFATLPAYAALILIDPGQWQIAINILITLALTAMLAMLLSAAISSLFRNTAAATATAYAVLIVLCAGTMLLWLGQDAPFSRRMVEAVLVVNPLAAALNLIGVSGFEDYKLIPGNWYIVGSLCVGSLMLLIGRVRWLTRPQ